jgi:AraC family transcriptional regulator
MGTEIARSVGRFVGLEEPPTLSTRFLQLAEIVGSRLCWNGSESGAPVRMDRSKGYLVCLQRRSLSTMPYWVNGKPMSMMPLNSGQFLFLDLNDEHASITPGNVDCVSMYASQEALQRFRQEHDLRPVGALRAASGVAFTDDIIRNLGESLVPAFERPEAVSQLFVDHVALAFMAHLTAFYAEQPAIVRPVRGGLARWQEQRTKDILMANMDGRVGLEELARASGLSRSHFARAFKASTGTSPLQWLMLQRIELAKNLLLNSSLAIDQIAHQCGFADQSHFTRAFMRLMSVTPSVWRRSRRY